MVFAQHFADDTGTFLVGPVAGYAHVVHGVEDAPMDRFEAVAHVGQGAGDDNAHGVVEIRGVHLGGDFDFADGSYHFARLFADQCVNGRVERGGDAGLGGYGDGFVSLLDLGQVTGTDSRAFGEIA